MLYIKKALLGILCLVAAGGPALAQTAIAPHQLPQVNSYSYEFEMWAQDYYSNDSLVAIAMTDTGHHRVWDFNWLEIIINAPQKSYKYISVSDLPSGYTPFSGAANMGLVGGEIGRPRTFFATCIQDSAGIRFDRAWFESKNDKDRVTYALGQGLMHFPTRLSYKQPKAFPLYQEYGGAPTYNKYYAIGTDSFTWDGDGDVLLFDDTFSNLIRIKVVSQISFYDNADSNVFGRSKSIRYIYYDTLSKVPRLEVNSTWRAQAPDYTTFGPVSYTYTYMDGAAYFHPVDTNLFVDQPQPGSDSTGDGEFRVYTNSTDGLTIAYGRRYAGAQYAIVGADGRELARGTLTSGGGELAVPLQGVRAGVLVCHVRSRSGASISKKIIYTNNR